MLVACDPEDMESADEHGAHGGKTDTTEFPTTDPNVVPEEVFDFLQTNGWGDMHLDFHTLRRWWLLPQQTRDSLAAAGKGPAELQEGDPGSGVEFCTMHSAMIGGSSWRSCCSRASGESPGHAIATSTVGSSTPGALPPPMAEPPLMSDTNQP